jgi:hypothetical protein
MPKILLPVHGDSSYAETLTAGLPVKSELFTPAEPGEDCYFTGPLDALETVVWRYVTPLDKVAEGDYVTADTADSVNKEEFEHFLWVVED